MGMWLRGRTTVGVTREGASKGGVCGCLAVSYGWRILWIWERGIGRAGR